VVLLQPIGWRREMKSWFYLGLWPNVLDFMSNSLFLGFHFSFVGPKSQQIPCPTAVGPGTKPQLIT